MIDWNVPMAFFFPIRYARCLIQYHLFIIICALIMTSICCALLIYKYDQWHFQAHLRVNLINWIWKFSLAVFFLPGISSTWDEKFGWLSKIHCSHSRNSYCTFISSFIVFECKQEIFLRRLSWRTWWEECLFLVWSTNTLSVFQPTY